jgi:hypothetical protein
MKLGSSQLESLDSERHAEKILHGCGKVAAPFMSLDKYSCTVDKFTYPHLHETYLLFTAY